MPVIVIDPNGDQRFSEPVHTAGYMQVKDPNYKEPEQILTTTNTTGDWKYIPPLTTDNTQPNQINPHIQPNHPIITPNIGINPYPSIGIGSDPFTLTPPKPLRQITDQNEWDELIKSLVDGHSGLSEKERVFDQLCQHIPDDIVRECWLNNEDAQKNPIESGMMFLVKYLLTQNTLNAIL